MAKCPLLALSGHPELHCTCPLLGVKRTLVCALHMSAFDPKRTLGIGGAAIKPNEVRMLAAEGSDYFTQSFNGTAGRFGQFMVPVKNSDNRAL